MLQFTLECKQCGGQVQCEEGKQVVVCPYCRSLNTVAKNIETQGGLVNRANYLRRCSEFDKALAVYEDILKLDNTDYEAHWGTVLCRYGIEYVEDPATHEKIPTCHRTSSESIFTDSGYKAALEYAPLDVREVYEREGAQIDGIQKNIIALANNQEKYDVFICYKQTDEAGNRTQDSVIAQELEFELSKRGYRVFFAQKTLEGKLGSAYEPIIFAALQSARAMVVLGTKAEHFSSVWVKNEWSRYLSLIKKGAQKTLIPAYRDMSPYDLPQEFSNLQALDMSKLGFVQDLCDGIGRLTREAKRSSETASAGTPGIETLLKRAFLFLEEGDFNNANAYLERILDINPEEPRAYIGKLMAEIGVRHENQLDTSGKELHTSPNYSKIMRFVDDATKNRFEEYNRVTVERVRQANYIKQAEEDKKRWAINMAEQAVRDCERRMPSGAILITFGILLMIAALAFFVIPNFIETASSDDTGKMLGGMVSVVLYFLPGIIPLSIGAVNRGMKKQFKKYSFKLYSGATVSEIAQAAGMTEINMTRTLNTIIRRHYLNYAYINNNTLYFQFEQNVPFYPEYSYQQNRMM